MPQQSFENQDVLQRLLNSQMKEVEKIGKQQVQEAVEQGVPLEQVAGQLQKMAQPQQQSVADPEQIIKALQQQLQQQQPQQVQPPQAAQQQGQQPTQQQAQEVLKEAIEVPKIRQILGGLIRQSGASRQRDLQNVLLEQEISGDLKLQKGVKELEELKNQAAVTKSEKVREAAIEADRVKKQDDFFNTILRPDTLPDASGKSLSLIESSITALDNVNQLLGITVDEVTGKINIANAKLLTNNNWLNKNRQALIRSRDVFLNKALRRDSGAAITEVEEKDFKKKFGFNVDVKSFLKNADVIAQSLVESQQQLKRDRNRILPNEQLQNFIKSEIQLGTPRDEIFSFLESKGEV